MSELSTTLHYTIIHYLFFFYLFFTLFLFFFFLGCALHRPIPLSRTNKNKPSPVLMDIREHFYLKTHKPTSWILLTSALQFSDRIYTKPISSLCKCILICVSGFRSLPLESQTQSHYFLGRTAINGS